jgi:aspartyl-tRNA(Asn)/glutamyl-tRNA(Gln) amidotransferase subunit C
LGGFFIFRHFARFSIAPLNSLISAIRHRILDKFFFSYKFVSVAGEFMVMAVEEVKYAARLAGLWLRDSELPKSQKDLSCILDYIQQLDITAANAVPASKRVSAASIDLRNDTVCRSLAAENALKNAPSVKEGMFNVPKVI